MTIRANPKAEEHRTKVSTFLEANVYSQFKAWIAGERRSVKAALEILIEEKLTGRVTPDRGGAAPVAESKGPVVVETPGLTTAELDERYGQQVCTGRDDVNARARIEQLCAVNGLSGWSVPAMRPEWAAARKAYLDTKWGNPESAGDPQ